MGIFIDDKNMSKCILRYMIDSVLNAIDKRILIFVSALLLSLVIYFVFIYPEYKSTFVANDPQFLPNVETYISNYGNPSLMDLPLSAFYINSSHNSYLGTTQTGSDVDFVKSALRMGARCIELDVHENFDDALVYHGTDTTNGFARRLERASGTENFGTMLKAVRDYAFKWTNDPLILYLEIFDADRENYMGMIRYYITKYLQDRLYEHRLTDVFNQVSVEKYLPNAPIRSLMGKICIVINFFGMNIGNGKGLSNRNKYLAPYVHATTDEPQGGWYGENSRAIMSGAGSDSNPVNCFKNFVRIFPSGYATASLSDNYETQPFIYNGYSMIALNFGWGPSQPQLNGMLKLFKKSNLIPKDYYIDRTNMLRKVEYFGDYRLIQNKVFNKEEMPGYSIVLPKGYAYRNCEWISGDYTLSIQEDGNMVIYNKNKSPKWHSKTFGNPQSTLVIQDDGNFVIYNQNGNSIWVSWTNVPYTSYMTLSAGDGNIYSVNKKGEKLNKLS